MAQKYEQTSSNPFFNAGTVATLKFKDVSLSRLYGILFTYSCLYSGYSFKIIRYPKYYLLSFKGWGESVKGGDAE